MMHIQKQLCLAALAVLVLGTTCLFAQSPPPNDDFANRSMLAGSSVTFTGTLQNATLQPGEPVGQSTGSDFPAYYAQVQSASVWWSWTAPTSGPVTLEVLSLSTNALKLGGLDVWTGADFSPGFSFVTGISLDIGRHPFVSFSASAGTIYQVRFLGTNFGDFALKLTQTNLPIVMVQPLSRTVSTNESVFFGVLAGGAGPLTYQWRFNGTDLPGETAPILALDYLGTNQSGSYSVVVSNAAGGICSDVANLTVSETAKSPCLMPGRGPDARFGFMILGEIGRFYRVESSTDLIHWSEERSFPQEFIYYDSPSSRARTGVVYNNGAPFFLPESSQQKFYRATLYIPSAPVCVNNLARLRFAEEVWSSQHEKPGWCFLTASDIAYCFKNAGLPSCPLGPPGCFPCSYLIQSAASNPICKISISHVLEQPEY
jgi:hypothetical protein